MADEVDAVDVEAAGVDEYPDLQSPRIVHRVEDEFGSVPRASPTHSSAAVRARFSCR
jgi:hypothetical protein